ncbi:glycosyltransferase family 2 protein [Neisseria chenwenguii]|uniref:Glycosyl transferase n=1 Tax=Neisseria chenwenguii TaxID=1853278 RepID=A0A220S4B7_9NEIS|nr:glycosyltransferase [Neisseria chenwenguii]ASK28266.1 glycosyl transferase [Neisseria chenwenguii]ROV57391.1 glycosyltransferase [Neisseria chenwenguii]
MIQSIPATAAMLVKNSERYLEEVLTALADFDEVLLLDNGSTDRTFDIAKEFPNVSYYKHDFNGFGPMKNLAAKLAQNDWIFSIDSDEIPDAGLIESIREAVAANRENAVYILSRLNHYNGRPIKGCGWYPDIIPRLYHRGFTRFSDRQVHEALVLPPETDKRALDGRLKHYSFENAEGLIRKMQQYSSLYADENRYKKGATPFKALLHGAVSFVKNYFLKRGFAYGSDGLTISVANAQGSYYKYVKLYERNRQITVSLIITTYNRPDALAFVLQSALEQTRLPDEIIVADDGSRRDTAEVVKLFREHTDIPVRHTWRPDDGFRAAEARNRALAVAKSDYIILIDGDMLLHRAFVADHLKHARKGRLIQGSRVLLTEGKTAAILKADSLPKLSVFSDGIEKRSAALRLPPLAAFTARKGNRRHRSIKTCNMAFFRSDALAVNGFDNGYVGWGREDSDFAARCFHNGMKRHNLRFAGIAYHLYHPEAERAALPQNDARLRKTLEQRKIRCEFGVDMFIAKDEEAV